MGFGKACDNPWSLTMAAQPPKVPKPHVTPQTLVPASRAVCKIRATNVGIVRQSGKEGMMSLQRACAD
jgi:hypothetical protein